MFGLVLRITHGQPAAIPATQTQHYIPAVTTPIVISDISDPMYPNQRKQLYVPYGTLGNPGHVRIPFTSSAAFSLETGSLAGHIAQGNVTVELYSGSVFGNAVAASIRMPMAITGGNTIIDFAWFPMTCKVLGVDAYLEEAATTAGTYTMALAAGTDGSPTNLLATPTFDLTTLVAQTITPLDLGATLDMIENTRLKLTIASNNVDLVAQGLVVNIKLGLR